MEIALTFIFGIVIGSLLNALVYRLRNEITLWGRSQCPSCKEKIHPAHLVPIVSFFLLRGRCSSCGVKIHPSYPIVEALGGVLWVLAFVHNPDPVGFVLEGSFFTYLLFVAAFDARWKLLPIEPMVFMTAIGLSVQFLDGDAVSSALGILLGAGFLGIQYLVSRGKWMGSGDLWLGASIGAWLGWQGMAVAFYLCYLLGGAVAIFILAIGRWKKSNRIAFAPFLALGSVGAVLFGQAIAEWFAAAFTLA